MFRVIKYLTSLCIYNVTNPEVRVHELSSYISSCTACGGERFVVPRWRVAVDGGRCGVSHPGGGH